MLITWFINMLLHIANTGTLTESWPYICVLSITMLIIAATLSFGPDSNTEVCAAITDARKIV